MSTIANPQQNIARTRTRRWFLAVIAGLAALAVLGVAVLDSALPTIVSPAEDAARTEIALLANNPELAAARRYAAESVAQAEAARLALNPELAAARRYAVAVESEAALLAANPELGLARGYVAGARWQRGDTFLAANPEMMIYRRHVAGQQPAVGDGEQLCCR